MSYIDLEISLNACLIDFFKKLQEFELNFGDARPNDDETILLTISGDEHNILKFKEKYTSTYGRRT